MKKILIIEEEQTLIDALQHCLQQEGHSVESARPAEVARGKPLDKYHLILLGTKMEDVPGLEAEKVIKMKKPLSTEELKTRVKAALRRLEIKKAGQVTAEDFIHSIDFEGLHIDTNTKQLIVDGRHTQATYLELELLSFLIKNKGKVFSRNELISKIWPEDTIVLERTVDVNITRIRKKIAPYGKHIKTRFGYGYYFS